VKPTLIALLMLTMLFSIAVGLARRWRFPHQPRLALLSAQERARKRYSPRVEFAIEFSLIAVACAALPILAVGAVVLLVRIAQQVG
jgi:hypothetical protein